VGWGGVGWGGVGWGGVGWGGVGWGGVGWGGGGGVRWGLGGGGWQRVLGSIEMCVSAKVPARACAPTRCHCQVSNHPTLHTEPPRCLRAGAPPPPPHAHDQVAPQGHGLEPLLRLLPTPTPSWPCSSSTQPPSTTQAAAELPKNFTAAAARFGGRWGALRCAGSSLQQPAPKAAQRAL
jgi:hypothetical protein